ncbi:hypothetical protein J3F84DRAFT_359257 [Trichoderma pleuroticola]
MPWQLFSYDSFLDLQSRTLSPWQTCHLFNATPFFHDLQLLRVLVLPLAASAAQTKHDSQRTRHGSQLLPGLYCTIRSVTRKCKRLRVAALLVAPYEEKPFVLIQRYADVVFELAPNPILVPHLATLKHALHGATRTSAREFVALAPATARFDALNG